MVKFCRDCISSKPEHRSEWSNKCFNDKVVKKNSYALANNCDATYKAGCGVSCSEERSKRSMFAACGMKGKLWEKENGI